MSEQLNAAPAGILDDWIPEPELSVELDEHPETTKRRRRLGEGPPYARVGRKIIYNRDAVRDWLKKRQVGAART